MRLSKSLLAAALALALLAPWYLRAQNGLPPEVAEHGYASLIAVNGHIISVDDAGRNTNPGNIYQAMAVKKDRIIALGTDEQIRRMANDRTVVLDLEGMTMIPGVIETHVHIFGDGQVAAQMGIRSPDTGISVTVQASTDMETTRLKVENALQQALTEVPTGEWVHLGIDGNPEERISDSQVFSWVTLGNFEPRERLDRLAPDNPVMIQVASRATVNSRAWEMMEGFFPELDEYYETTLPDAPDAVEKGLIGVEGRVALQWEIWWRKHPVSLLADLMRRSLEVAASHGVTTFSSRLTHPRIMDSYSMLNREGKMPIRFAALMEGHRRPRNSDTVRQVYQMTGNLTGIGNDYFWIHGVASELWDSSFPQMCLGPDLPAPAVIKRREMCPGPGKLYYDTLRNALAAGWRLAGIHGIGSHGVRIFLQMVESVMQENGLTVEDVRNLRLTLEHNTAIGLTPDVLAGLKKYGIILSVHPNRLFREPDYIRDYGPEAEAFMEPIKSWLDYGIDVVGQTHRYRNLGYIFTIPMTREIIDGKVVLPNEAIDRVTVLKMWTNWASRYVLKENDIGSLEVGKLADFVVLDRDWLTIPVEEFAAIRPQATVVGGEIRFLDRNYARRIGKEPAGYQFPEGYEPWGKITPEY